MGRIVRAIYYSTLAGYYTSVVPFNIVFHALLVYWLLTWSLPSSKSLELKGAINATGELHYTNGPNSVPVAVWAFEQVG